MNKNKIYQYVLALGHGCSDINQGALSAVLPFIIAAYHFDYTTAAMLVTVSNLFGSIVQPVFGNIADKKNKPWIMALGVLLAGGGMALTGLISNFYGLCVAVIISGIGIAMFHPQAAQLVSLSSQKNQQGKGISIFSFGGKIGSILGPILTSSSILLFGMKGTLVFLIPSFIFGMISSLFLKDFKKLGESAHIYDDEEKSNDSQKTSYKQDDWPAFIKLCITVFGRSIITNGMSIFLLIKTISFSLSSIV
ncbi:MAG: MFS transporter [Coprobacillus cateniformis]|uniref:MFS transporter n=1 Tax=Longibaculum muris TaxID=1796628 RepID=UPI003AB347AF|nr:MFS transporter [Coprobacillus cateniformis]